jgi:CRISPR-associated exonuclease Cas4
MTWLILASLVILALAVLLRRHARLSSASLGLPGELLYRDDDGNDELLVSDTHGLVGKPDYIRKESGELVPVERKSRKVTGSGPYEGEVLQLAAYCLLVEERFGKTIKRGQLQYQNRSLEIPFDADLRARLLRSLNSIRAAEAASDISRSHNNPAKCRSCGFRQSCPDSLV